MFALGIGPTGLAVVERHGWNPAPPPPPPPQAPISAVAATGWQATMVAPADLAMAVVNVTRQGFTATGAATTMVEQLLTTRRVRQPYPNHASLTASSVALSDYVYAGDTIGGVANSSAETSPRPIVNWIMPHRLAVANTIEAELVAFHRNAGGGRQVACVVFTATDGTNTATATVSTATVSGRTGDRNAVLSHKANLDLAGLNAGLITLNARVYPRIGGAASVADSAVDGNAARGFSPRYFLKTAAAPFYAYVRAGGTAGGVFHQTAATAAATPFGTIDQLWRAINDGAAGRADNVIVRVGNDGGTPWVLDYAFFVAITQNVAAITITRDPDVARANARVGFGANAFRPRLGGGSLAAPLATGAMLLRDIAIVRSGLNPIMGEGAQQLEVMFDDCSFDNASNNATWLQNAHDYHFGTSFANLSGNTALQAAAEEHRLLRGVTLQPGATPAGVAVEGWCVVGSAINNPQLTRGARSRSGGIIAFNRLSDPPSAATMLDIAGDETVTGFAFVQNVVEYTSAAPNPVLAISSDAATGGNTHIVIHHNTHAGALLAGRWNAFYDDGPTRRTSRLHSIVGNIAATIYTKGDVYRGVNEGDGSGAATGNWAFKHGVGCRGNFTQFQAADAVGPGSNQAQDYAGIGASYGASQTVRNSPAFASYAGTAVSAGPTYTPGAGGGDYTLTAGSTARALVNDPVLTFGLSGSARAATNDSAGAYAA